MKTTAGRTCTWQGKGSGGQQSVVGGARTRARAAGERLAAGGRRAMASGPCSSPAPAEGQPASPLHPASPFSVSQGCPDLTSGSLCVVWPPGSLCLAAQQPTEV